MIGLARLRFPVWLWALAGFLILFGAFYVTNTEAKDAGEAAGYAFLPGVFGAGVMALLGVRRNRFLAYERSKEPGQDIGSGNG